MNLDPKDVMSSEYESLMNRATEYYETEIMKLCKKHKCNFISAWNTFFYVEGTEDNHDGRLYNEYYIEVEVDEFDALLSWYEDLFGTAPNMFHKNGE